MLLKIILPTEVSINLSSDSKLILRTFIGVLKLITSLSKAIKASSKLANGDLCISKLSSIVVK